MRVTGPFSLLFLISFAQFAFAYRRRYEGHPRARTIHMENQSGSTIMKRWKHPDTGELADPQPVEGVPYGGESLVNSYIGHVFQIDEMPSKRTGKCRLGKCRRTFLTVSDKEDQFYVIDMDFQVVAHDHHTRAVDQAQKAISVCSDLTDIDELADCLAQASDAVIQEEQTAIEFEHNNSVRLGHKLVEYACNDPKARPVSSRNRHNLTLGVHTVQVLFQSDINALFLVDDLIDADLCTSLLADGVGDSTGGRVLPLSAASRHEDTLTRLRVFLQRFYGNIVMQQDPLLLLEYTEARATSDQQGECKVEASGVCLRPPQSLEPQFASANAKAWLRVVCEAPTVGGLLAFPNAGVLIKPKVGQTLLAVYESGGKRETFLDETIQCPVEQGHLSTATRIF